MTMMLGSVNYVVQQLRNSHNMEKVLGTVVKPFENIMCNVTLIKQTLLKLKLLSGSSLSQPA